MESNIAVVDKNDNIITYKPRSVVDKEGFRYRVSALWILNSKNQFLLARRAYTKSHHPGRWGPAAAGTVDEGETYEENMIKEAEEELGLTNLQLTIGPKTETTAPYIHFTQWFICTVDKPSNEFQIQEDEVVEVKWFSKEELEQQLKEHPEEFLRNIGKYAALFE